ncbi:MAG: DinB family protein [candidate division Zixibacteria bacterium]|nr:DinB family protein [candidate division Zixibacteria bacterium]
MIPELQGYSLIFRSTHGLFHRALDGITKEQALERSNGANPILWIAGHIVTVRSSFMRVIGGSVVVPWAGHFRRGDEVKNQDQWPSLAEVRAKWDEVHGAFMIQLETVTSAQLSALTEAPGLDKTVLGTLGLAALHDSYHVGQLAAARRRYGLERIVG